MKLVAYSRSGLFTGQVFGQLKGPQCFTKLPRSSVRFGQLTQPWQQSHRTLADSTTTQKKESPEAAAAAKSRPTQSANLPLQDQVRLLMRRVPYPVAIITATDPHGPVEKAYRGMTVSSFSTVTLNPEPVLSFNVKRPSETLSALLSSGRFLVHLLAPAKETAALARDFAKGNHNLSILSGHGDFGFVAHGPTGVDGDNINTTTADLFLFFGGGIRME